MDIVVLGGTGFIGTHLCRHLTADGHTVTAVSRSARPDTVPAGVQAVAGDMTDTDTAAEVIAGHDAVVNLIALSPLFDPPRGRSHRGVHLGATQAAVQAATAHDVSLFLQLSALGADPTGPTAYHRAKGHAETVVRESELDWRVFRPSVVFGDGGEFLPFLRRVTPGPIKPLPGGGTVQFQPLWVGDLTAMLGAALTDATHRHATYDLGGPDALSMAELTRLVHGGRGTIVSVPQAVTTAGLTVADAVPFVPVGRDQAVALQQDNVPADNDIDAFGLTPADLRTVDSYLSRSDQ